MKNFGIHWFRRDLRLHSNKIFFENFKQNDGRILGVFCFDEKFLSRSDFSHNRFGFFLKTLAELQSEIREKGGDLIVINETPQKAFPQLFEYFKSQKYPLPSVSFGRDYEPYARSRDSEMIKIFNAYQLNYNCQRDHLILEPEEVLKDNKTFYQIFTPYSRRWLESFYSNEIQRRIFSQAFQIKLSLQLSEFKAFPFTDSLAHFEKINQKSVSITLPEAGSAVALQKLAAFKKNLEAYTVDRDFPALKGTSQLSIYLKNGSIVPSQIMAGLELKNPTQYLKEIIWREFYYSILFHRPEVEHLAFQSQYQNINWINNTKYFERWCEGSTGFPIVDAGMRQLKQTGWMHNRVRMIVASFLSKDLLIDWRQGEKYFMKMLLDGDMASNNGGWQWAASTGCDAQPYFRIFNPWLQSKKFDPDGAYIKKFIPELKDISNVAIHDPEGDRGKLYPKPIIDHDVQKRLAINLFKK